MAFLASAILRPVCERLIITASEEYKLVRDVKEELRKLIFTVSLVKEVVEDAEQKQVKEQAVCHWLRSLKQVLYDAEDILDEAAVDSALETSTRSVNSIPGFGSIRKILSGHELAHQIKTIRMELDEICAQKDALGLQVLAGDIWPINSKRRRLDTSSLMVDNPCIVGRDDEKRKIIQMLMGSELENWTSEQTSGICNTSNVHVLSLVGMGGVGKTTLAKLVFSDPTVKQHFQVMIWVCVSENFDLKRITGEIMDAICGSSDRQKESFEILMNWDSAQKRLKDKIEEKKFLLVLDDVWEQDPFKWESLYGPLRYGVKGSRIIVTTRNQRVSDMVKSFCIPLKSLSDEDLWPVFKSYAFDGGSESYGHVHIVQLESIGRRVVKKLKGSPLAAKTIGRLLNRSLDVRHWKNILKSEIFMLEQHPNDISPVLKLSYDHLPGHLKQCFAYCSIFPKDYRFSRSELVQHWVSQNFIQTSRGGANIQSNIPGGHFDDLLYMSFFEESTYAGCYVMHDLIHDLAESISEDDCLRLGDGVRPNEFPETIRHVSIATEHLDPMKLKELCKYGKLRTLHFLSRCRFDLSPHLDHLFMKLKRLRVLGLRKCRVSELPPSIGDLKHLRFVDLSQNHISQLPESFCGLHNLQVLKLDGCWRLRALPRNMSALVNLMHLEASCELVSSIQDLGKLTALQELNIRGLKAKELGDMSMLRELGILNLEQVASEEEAMQARLDAKEDLETLHLGWKGDDRACPSADDQTLEEEVLEGLRPVDGITELVISRYGGVRSPRWLQDPSWVSSSFLQTVELYFCRNWEALPPLGQLCCLKSLIIVGMSSVRRVGPEFMGCCADKGGGFEVPGFPSLEGLYISNMPEWEEWEVPHHEEDGKGGGDQGGPQQQILFLPRLRRLRIDGCPRLRALPPLPRTLESLEINRVGLSHLSTLLGCRGGAGGDADRMRWSSSSAPSLSRLSIRDCPNLRSLNDGLLQHPLSKLLVLRIASCEELTCLPDGVFGHLTSLKSLGIWDCPKLTFLPSMSEDDAMPCSLEEVAIRNDMMEHLLLKDMRRLTCLSKLCVSVGSSSNMAQLLLGSILEYQPAAATLRSLEITRDHHRHRACSSSSNIPSLIVPPTPPPPPPLEKVVVQRPTNNIRDHLTSLTSLYIQDCSDLLQVSGLPSSLESLSINGDTHLDDRILTTYLKGLCCLRSLSIYNCPLVTSLPAAEVLSHLTALESLDVMDCKELVSLGGGVHTLISLQQVDISNCPKLLHLVEASAATSSVPPTTVMRAATQLKALHIEGSSPQQITMWLRQCSSSLRRLDIGSCPQLTCFHVNGGGDDEIGRELEVALLSLAPTLRYLEFQNCDNLRSLPSKLRCLSSLEELNIWRCPQIQCMPSGGLPKSLQSLQIDGCPELEERCREEGGRHRPFVSHVPSVYLPLPSDDGGQIVRFKLHGPKTSMQVWLVMQKIKQPGEWFSYALELTPFY